MAAGETTTVRVRRSDSERLRALAGERAATVVDVVHDAIDALEREQFLGGLREDQRRLRSDPAAWEAYERERREWDELA